MYPPGDVNFIKKDIALALKRYPKLSLVEQSGKLPALKGHLELNDGDTGECLDTVQVYIQYLKSFPYAYPQVFEIGGRFRGHKNMHINGDGTLCLSTPPIEILKTRSGLLTIPFIESTLIPNLAWRLFKILEPDIKMRENNHGSLGILEGYMEVLGLESKTLALEILERYSNSSLPDRNDPCICKSGKKYKHCHQRNIDTLGCIPKETVRNHFSDIKARFNSQDA